MMFRDIRCAAISTGIITFTFWCLLEYFASCRRMKKTDNKQESRNHESAIVRVALVEEPTRYVISRKDALHTTHRSRHLPLKVQMSSGGERQCGLGSLLPMSCRGRAEAFARRLHTRLRRLGAEPRPGEDEWLTAQPSNNRRHHSDSDVYFDFDIDLGSPSDETADSNILNGQKSQAARMDPESGCVFSSPVDPESSHSNSDSDGNYFDLENDGQAASSKTTRRSQRFYDDSEAMSTIDFTKLKLSSDLRDQLVNCHTPTPDRRSPIKTQPLARENGFADYGSLSESQNKLFSAIQFDECKKKDSVERETFSTANEVDQIDGADFFPNGFTSPQEPEFDEIDFSQKVNGTKNFPLRNGQLELPPYEDEYEVPASKQYVAHENGKTKDNEVSQDIAKESNIVENEEEGEKQEEEQDDSTQTDEALEAPAEESNETSHNDAENDDRPQRVRRCSSLRTGKTPPGTPGRKKIVRFADVLGLDLADVKTFMDDIPNIPKSAFEDLRDADLGSAGQTDSSLQPLNLPPLKNKHLVRMFQIPGDLPNFLDILNNRSVCLENAVVQEGATVGICGTVRVRNLDFHKSVQIRYSLDGWKTFSDLQATYVPNSCDGFSDRFQFLLYAHTLQEGQKLEFAVRFMCKGCQFWDNNSGANYCFHCISNGQPSNYYQLSCFHPADSWNASFY